MENLKESAELAAGKLDPKAEVVVICKTLKARRKDMGLNQKQFAELLGVKPEYISRIEAGKVDLQLSTLIRLSRGLKLQLVISPVEGV